MSVLESTDIFPTVISKFVREGKNWWDSRWASFGEEGGRDHEVMRNHKQSSNGSVIPKSWRWRKILNYLLGIQKLGFI
jgi:hypothetical protein